MQKSIWVRHPLQGKSKFAWSCMGVASLLAIWFALTTAAVPEQRLVNRNVLPNPVEIVSAFPALVAGSPDGFVWNKSLFFAIWASLSRELVSFLVVLALAVPLGIFMSVNHRTRAFFYPMLVIGTFIPIAALIPLTQAIFGIGELQKIIFLSLGMFFVLLGLVIKEMDEVDDILLQTAYCLGFGQLRTVFLVVLPTALPRIWKHLSAVFGLGWGYIIFAEMINSSGGDSISGIGWLFIARQRRFQVPDMYAIFFVIILFAFLISLLFKISGTALFKHERGVE